jgi:hypothetical protein
MDWQQVSVSLIEHVQWVFSGIGVLLIGAIFQKLQYLAKLLGQLIKKNDKIVVHEEFPFAEIKYKILHARTRILILDSWLARPDALPEVLKVPATNNVEIRILFLGGEGAEKILCQRMNDLDSRVKSPLEMSDLAVQQVINWPIDLRRKINIHRFVAQPPFVIYLIDDTIYMGLFWHTKISTLGPFMQIGEPSILFSNIVETFDKIWEKKSTKYPIDS